MAGEMQCVVCHWWPPLVGVRKGKRKEQGEVTYRLTEANRWVALLEHIEDMADVELSDRLTKSSPLYDAPPGPHEVLMEQVEALGEQLDALAEEIEQEE